MVDIEIWDKPRLQRCDQLCIGIIKGEERNNLSGNGERAHARQFGMRVSTGVAVPGEPPGEPSTPRIMNVCKNEVLDILTSVAGRLLSPSSQRTWGRCNNQASSFSFTAGSLPALNSP